MLLHDLLAKYIERRFSDDNADNCWCTLQTAAHQLTVMRLMDVTVTMTDVRILMLPPITLCQDVKQRELNHLQVYDQTQVTLT